MAIIGWFVTEPPNLLLVRTRRPSMNNDLYAKVIDVENTNWDFAAGSIAFSGSLQMRSGLAFKK